MENINEEIVKHLQEEIRQLKHQRNELITYVHLIDDRNSLKLQTVKQDMQKILAKK